MVVIDVSVTNYMYEVTHSQITYLSNHVCEQTVAGNIEWHAQEHVRTALVHLATESTIAYIELTEDVAGWQTHLIQFSWIPGRENVSTTLRVGAYALYQPLQLIYFGTVSTTPVTPLYSIDSAGIAPLLHTIQPSRCQSIIVPDGVLAGDTVGEFTQTIDIAGPFNEPQQLAHHGSPCQPLGC